MAGPLSFRAKQGRKGRCRVQFSVCGFAAFSFLENVAAFFCLSFCSRSVYWGQSFVDSGDVGFAEVLWEQGLEVRLSWNAAGRPPSFTSNLQEPG